MDEGSGGSCAGCLVVGGGALIAVACGVLAWLAAYNWWGRVEADLLAGAAFCIVFVVVCGLVGAIFK